MDEMSTRGSIIAFLESRWAIGRRPGTVKHYRDVLYPYARYADKHDVGWPPTVGDLRAWLAQKRDEGIRDTTIATYWRALSAWLNWCEAEDLLGEQDNPINRLDKPRIKRRIPRAVDRATLKKLLETIADAGRRGDRLATRDHALFRFVYDTGCRCSETSNLRLDDLDTEEQAALIRQAKGGDRVVFFGKLTAYALERWLALRPVGGDYVFTNRQLAPARLKRGGIYTRLVYWCAVAGVDAITVHGLRHSHATHALQDGISISDLQRQLGHSSLIVTEMYLHGTDPNRKEAYRKHSPSDSLLQLQTEEEGKEVTTRAQKIAELLSELVH